MIRHAWRIRPYFIMNKKFQNKYRIESTRKPGWDYSTPGLYFVTICTQHREHYFGEIRNGEMFLSDIGNIVKHEWIKTPEIRPDMHLFLGAFVVMPDHFHAIIGIGMMDNVIDPVVEAQCIAPLHPQQRQKKQRNTFGPQRKNLASIIRGFKSSVTAQARKIGTPFAWQSRFHDHIIRNSNEYDRIDAYIKNNVANWKCDKYLR